MRKNNSLINIEKNKDTNININNYIEVMDELSCNSIRKNYNNVADLENEFSERLEYSQEVLTKKLLPKQLQDDFDIVSKCVDGKMEFSAKAKTEDAYKKHPIRMNYTMQFNSIEEANQFRNNGIEELQRIADMTQKPIEIPNITKMREFLGEYINPVAPTTKYGSDRVKLYICPQPVPPAQKYSIEIFNEQVNFKIYTSLRVLSIKENIIELSNKESKKEPYNVNIKLINLKKEKDRDLLQGQFNISISIKDEYLDSCEINKEMMKFRFLIEELNSCILINNEELNANVFTFNNCGKNKYIKKDYKKFYNLMSLIDKVMYISKIKKVDIKYDIDEFIKNEELINFLHNEIKGKNYKSKTSLTCTAVLPEDIDLSKLMENDGKLVYKTIIDKITLFDIEFELKKYEMIMFECHLVIISDEKIKNKIKIISNNTIFNLVK